MLVFVNLHLITIFSRPKGSEVTVQQLGLAPETPVNPDHIGGYHVAAPIFTGIETKFGLCLPKFRRPEANV